MKQPFLIKIIKCIRFCFYLLYLSYKFYLTFWYTVISFLLLCLNKMLAKGEDKFPYGFITCVNKINKSTERHDADIES